MIGVEVWTGRALALGCAITLLLGCKESSRQELRDSEGRRFDLECAAAGEHCVLRTEGVALSYRGRLVGICPAQGASPLHPADCRALVCKADTDCPPPTGATRGSCLDGLCVDPSRPLGSDDAVMLCLAGTGTGHQTPQQVERYALGLNCGEPCAVPAPCQKR